MPEDEPSISPGLAELQECLHGEFWKGPNLTLADDCFLPARDVETQYAHPQTVSVRANASHFPPGLSSFDGIGYLFTSMRSRYAQLGIEIVGGWILPDRNIWSAIQRGEEQSIPIGLANLSAAPISLPKKTQICRLYSHFATERLEGMPLEEAIQSGEIHIDGEEGNDWSYVSPPDNDLAAGIKIKLTRYNWIKPRTTPIGISDTGPNYRQEIDQLLNPIPLESKKPILWVAETPNITLSPRVNSVICSSLNLGEDNPKAAGFQIHSQLIDSGSDWPIRVEGFSTTSPDRLPKTAVFFFF